MISAYGDHVVVKREELTLPPDIGRRIKTRRGNEVVLESGVIVPEVALAKATWGLVISVGPRTGGELSPGDRVLILWTWKPVIHDKDVGDVEILEVGEILAREVGRYICLQGHDHPNVIQKVRCNENIRSKVLSS
jgi:co-chaperonin GroES (HSP10)